MWPHANNGRPSGRRDHHLNEGGVMRKSLLATLLVCAVVALAGQAFAQERVGGLVGVATEERGGVLPGATVTITNKATGAVRTAVTGTDGGYSVPDLDPGRYTVAF